MVKKKGLEGAELLIALMSALKRRAATCLTELNLNDLTWDSVKQTLLAKFSRSKTMQDYFDEIIKFQIGNRESATEAAMRLWNMIENIPKTKFSEEAIIGFVMSLLCQRDNLIRR